MTKMPKGVPFKKGNQLAKGNAGPKGHNFLTQALVSQLNEMQKDEHGRNTSKAVMHDVVAKLIALARGGVITYTKRVKDRETNVMVTRTFYSVNDPDLGALREIFDRVQGKAKQSVDVDGNVTVILHFDKEDEDA